MIRITNSVGQAGQNLKTDLVKIQTALFALKYLEGEDLKKEMLQSLMSSSSSITHRKILSTEIHLLEKIKLLPTGRSKIQDNNLQATIAAIKQFQKKAVGSRRPDGRVDPNGKTLKTINKNLKKIPQPKVVNIITDIPSSFETTVKIGSSNSVEIVGKSIVVKLSHSGATAQKKISIEKSRTYIVNNYNWNGIVKLLHFAAKQNKETYLPPTNLKGLEEDNLLIVPNNAIKNIIKVQLTRQLKKTPPSSRNLNAILKSIDGLPGRGFINNIIKKKRVEFFNETSNKSFKDIFSNNKITIPWVDDKEDVLYGFFRNIVHIRNGLWSDNQGIVNVIGLRRVLNKMSKTQYNDGIAVCWKTKNGKKKVELTLATTEPGNRFRYRQLTSQTVTLVAGYHNTRQPAGRTRNAIKQSANAGSLSWCEGDTTMNFHQGGSKFDFPNNDKYWLTQHGIDGSIQKGFSTNKFSEEQMFELNVLLSKIYLMLSQYGGDKTEAPFQNLKKMAASKPMRIESNQDGIISVVQDGQSKKKKINIQEVKKWLVDYWYHKRLLPENRLKIFTILQDISSLTDSQIKQWKKLSKAQVLTKIDDQMVTNIIKKQIQFFPKLDDIDGKAGPTFYKTIVDIRPSIVNAKTDFPELESRINQLSNFPLTKLSLLQKRLKTGMKINTDNNRANVKKHTRYDDVAKTKVIQNVSVGVWSAGCQVIYDTEKFYNFWTKLLERAQASGQRRWYYTLIDATGWKKTDVI